MSMPSSVVERKQSQPPRFKQTKNILQLLVSIRPAKTMRGYSTNGVFITSRTPFNTPSSSHLTSSSNNLNTDLTALRPHVAQYCVQGFGEINPCLSS
jgi:hypothetical protein